MQADEALYLRILKLEQSLLTSEVRHSAEQLAALLSDDFTEFTSSGKEYRYQCGDIFVSPADGVIQDFALRPLSDGCVLATYRFVRTDGSASLRSSIWQQFGEQWKMVFHQGTPEAQP